MGYDGAAYSGAKKSGTSRSATLTSGMRYSFHPVLRAIPRRPEAWKPAARRPPNPFVSPFVRPSPFVMPLVRPRPFVRPFVLPNPFVSPLVRPRPFVSPFVRPTPLVSPLVRPRPFVRPSPFVRPRRPFVRPPRPFVRPPNPFVRPALSPPRRSSTRPFVNPFFDGDFSVGFAGGGTARSGFGFDGRSAGFLLGFPRSFVPPRSSSTISWIAALPRSSSSSSNVRLRANFTPQFAQVVASIATGASHIGHGTVASMASAASGSVC